MQYLLPALVTAVILGPAFMLAYSCGRTKGFEMALRQANEVLRSQSPYDWKRTHFGIFSIGNESYVTVCEYDEEDHGPQRRIKAL
jgi:hypothetical protein